jgi:hypothetical protein
MTNNYPSAVTELRALGYKRRSLAYMKERLTAIDTAKYTVNSSTASAIPTAQGGTRYEDRLDDLIMKADIAATEYAALRVSCIAAEAALSALNDDERMVLELCYVERPADWVAAARCRLYVEQRQVYHIKDNALKHYSEIRNFA